MQRILNNPDDIVDEMLKGFLKTHSDIVEATENPRVVKAKGIQENKVGVVTGGGSGHKPAFVGYVGKNMCDAAAVGEICSSPTAAAFLDAFKVTDQGQGVACLYGNYSGDNMNVKMAVKMAKKQGITVKTVVANDDVASAPKDQREKRRGVAGEILMWKAGGAKAAKGGSLDEVIAAAQKAIDNTRSVGIGLTPCTLPAVGKRTWLNIDLQIVFPVFRMFIHISNNTQSRLDLVRNILQQFLGVLNTNHSPCIINTDIDGATLSIGKAAYPFQVFIPPGFLIFDVLTFCHKQLPPVSNSQSSSKDPCALKTNVCVSSFCIHFYELICKLLHQFSIN